MGWKARDDSFLFFFKHKHAGVAVLVIILVFSNLTAKAKAGVASETAGKTILSTLVQNEFGTPEEDELIEEFLDQETATNTLQSYLDNLSSIREQPLTDTAPSAETEEPLIGDGTAVVKPDIIFTNPSQPQRTDIVEYAIESGDTISAIASKFGISINTILWANNLTANSMIRPGDKLTILPVSGIAHVVKSGENLAQIAKKYDVDLDLIQDMNKLADGKLFAGQKLIIPGGRKINQTNYAFNEPKERSSGLKVIKDLITKPAAKVVSGAKMAWPTVGYRITQYYSWRHLGLDVANKVGTPLYAAESGTIETAGWGRGYGNQVLINHGGGKKTRYAHLSKFYVGVGDEVKKGDVIGAMGSTGWSTGSHLHFEVIINGTRYNPLNYIK